MIPNSCYLQVEGQIWMFTGDYLHMQVYIKQYVLPVPFVVKYCEANPTLRTGKAAQINKFSPGGHLKRFLLDL